MLPTNGTATDHDGIGNDYKERSLGDGLNGDERGHKSEAENLCPDELDELHLLTDREKERTLDADHLGDLRVESSLGDFVDEDRTYVLELFQRFENGEPLSENELYELSAFDRLRLGEKHSTEDMEDLKLSRSRFARLPRTKSRIRI
jgi:hypothetical protein